MDIAKLAWLAGIVDGEGVIGFYEVHAKGRKHPTFQTHIKIINGNTDLIAECSNIMSEIVGRKVIITRDARKNRPNIYWHVSVESQVETIKILSAIEPYLVGKKSQAQLLLGMLKKHSHGTPMTKVERDVVGILKKMKREKIVPVEGNTELSRKHNGSFRACVEDRRATTQDIDIPEDIQSSMF